MVQHERAILGGVGLPAAQTDAVLRKKNRAQIRSLLVTYTFDDISTLACGRMGGKVALAMTHVLIIIWCIISHVHMCHTLSVSPSA